jgi:hypothetical protein
VIDVIDVIHVAHRGCPAAASADWSRAVQIRPAGSVADFEGTGMSQLIL